MSQDLVTLSAGENVHKQISARLRIVPAFWDCLCFNVIQKTKLRTWRSCRLLLLVWKSQGLYRMTEREALNPICPADLRCISWNTSIFKSVRSSLHTNWLLVAQKPSESHVSHVVRENQMCSTTFLLHQPSLDSHLTMSTTSYITQLFQHSAISCILGPICSVGRGFWVKKLWVKVWRLALEI